MFGWEVKKDGLGISYDAVVTPAAPAADEDDSSCFF